MPLDVNIVISNPTMDQICVIEQGSCWTILNCRQRAILGNVFLMSDCLFANTGTIVCTLHSWRENLEALYSAVLTADSTTPKDPSTLEKQKIFENQSKNAQSGLCQLALASIKATIQIGLTAIMLRSQLALPSDILSSEQMCSHTLQASWSTECHKWITCLLNQSTCSKLKIRLDNYLPVKLLGSKWLLRTNLCLCRLKRQLFAKFCKYAGNLMPASGKLFKA